MTTTPNIISKTRIMTTPTTADNNLLNTINTVFPILLAIGISSIIVCVVFLCWKKGLWGAAKSLTRMFMTSEELREVEKMERGTVGVQTPTTPPETPGMRRREPKTPRDKETKNFWPNVD